MKKIKHSKEVDNCIMFLTGINRPLAQKVESLEIKDGKFVAKLKIKINTKGWVRIEGEAP